MNFLALFINSLAFSILITFIGFNVAYCLSLILFKFIQTITDRSNQSSYKTPHKGHIEMFTGVKKRVKYNRCPTIRHSPYCCLASWFRQSILYCLVVAP